MKRNRSVLGGRFLGGGVCARCLVDTGSAFVFLAYLFNHAAAHEVLKLLVGAQTEHFLPAAHGVPQFEICKNPLEQIIETEHFFLGENIHKFIGDMVGYAA